MGDSSSRVPEVETTASEAMDNDAVGWQPLEIFHNFPNLPAEIRVQIWALAFSSPRIIVPFQMRRTPEQKQRHQELTLNHQHSPLIVSYSPCDPSHALQICRETRDRALARSYLFNTGNYRLFLDASTDVLVLSSLFAKNTPGLPSHLTPCSIPDFRRYAKMSDVRQLKKLCIGADWLRHLATGAGNPAGGIEGPSHEGPMFKRLSGLEDITIRFDWDDKSRRTHVRQTARYYGPELIKRVENKPWSPHCERCADARRDLGSGCKGWRFPTFKDYERILISRALLQRREYQWTKEKVEEYYCIVLKLVMYMEWMEHECLVVFMWQWIHDGECSDNSMSEYILAYIELFEDEERQ